MKEYHPAKFWESRYRKFDITASGHADLPYEYNAWLYTMKEGKIRKALQQNITAFANKNVLELGCGTGAYVGLWKNLDVASLTGIDISPTSVANLNSEFPDYNFYCQDISDAAIIPLLEERKFEIVTAIGVLVHVVNDEDMRSALKNIAHLVTDNGLVLISDYMLRDDQPAQDHGYMKFRNLQMFKDDLQEVGLELVSVVPFYFFMIDPIDTPSVLGKTFLRKVNVFFKKLIRKWPDQSGRFLYYIDSMITPMLTDGPSEELYICIKKP